MKERRSSGRRRSWVVKGEKGRRKGFRRVDHLTGALAKDDGGWDEGRGNDRDRCPPPFSVRKGCDVSRVNLTLIRRVINGRVVFTYIYI